ncbi:MAG: ABC transporter substrate-binding protein [Alphaproteobacteria bacterium]|nr:ABC transporter substrate-binding protein [Alphaproteobacteria bacterium]
MSSALFARRAVLAFFVAAAGFFAAAEPSTAMTGAETFVQTNVTKGLAILNNKAVSNDQKRSQFQGFILGLTSMKRIALFTLGQYKRTATPQEQDQFAAAFQNYATAVYQSYFAKYSGQSLKVTGSTERAPGDVIVQTQLIDPNDHSGQQPLEVDFRILSENGHFVVVDFSVAGIWLAIEERDQFSSFLGQNNGSIPTLIKHLGDLAKQYH